MPTICPKIRWLSTGLGAGELFWDEGVINEDDEREQCESGEGAEER